MDEKTIIREQERLAREKKRQKNRRKRRLAAVAAAALLIGAAWYIGWGRKMEIQPEQTAVEVTAQSGQEIVYATLTGVKGNEITYRETGEETGQQEEDQQEEAQQQEQTALIPVGTEVVTRLGTVTTFSRLAAGDNVALITQADGEDVVIVRVYIL